MIFLDKLSLLFLFKRDGIAGRVTQNSEPLPFFDLASSEPPNKLVSCLTIDKPKPYPP